MRPTPDRVRETLFDWLQPVIVGAECLDLFAGSGALGFEAASRGAAEVVMIERDRRAWRGLGEQATRLAAETVDVRRADALEWLAGPPRGFDVVFLDPPFAGELLTRVARLLHDHLWLRVGSLIYVEMGRGSPAPILPESWLLKKKGSAGQVKFQLFEERGEQRERESRR